MENILVKVKNLILSVDFIVIDIKEDEEVPLIMGHLFIDSDQTIIDVERGKLIMPICDESVMINFLKQVIIWRLPRDVWKRINVRIRSMQVVLLLCL